MNATLENMVTRAELAEYLRVPQETLRQLLKKPAQQILADAQLQVGRKIVYSRKSVERYVAERAGK